MNSMAGRTTGNSTSPAAERAAEFERMFREHLPALYRCAYRWTGGRDQAEDLVQDLLTRLYPRLEELRGVERIKPWALRIMYRMFVDQLRRERASPVRFGLNRSAERDDDDDEGEPQDPQADPATLVERDLTTERILAAWSQLRREHRVVISMHDVEGYSLVELVELTGTELGTLKSRLHRGRARLRELLAGERIDATDRV